MQHPFIIKTLSKLGIKNNLIKLIKNTKKPTASILFNNEKLKAFLLTWGKKKKSPFTNACKLVPEVLANEQDKKIIWKVHKLIRNKTCFVHRWHLFTDDLHKKSEKNWQKFLELSHYSKVARYKVNIQKSVAFLCISNKQVEFKINIDYTLFSKMK